VTIYNREIQTNSLNDYSLPRQCFWRDCFIATFLVATLVAPVDAEFLTFNDPTTTPDGNSFGGDNFGFSVALNGNNVLIGASGDDTLGVSVGQAHLFTIPEPSTLVLAALALLGLLAHGRRRRAQQPHQGSRVGWLFWPRVAATMTL